MEEFHHHWTETVGKLYYDKSAWKDLEIIGTLVAEHGNDRAKEVFRKMAQDLSTRQTQAK
jgi:hypothetical protein